VAPGEIFTIADDRWAITSRFVAGLRYGIGDLTPAGVPFLVSPVQPAPPPRALLPIAVCVAAPTGLSVVEALYDPVTGDTTVAGTAFAARHPAKAPVYAAGAGWFAASDTLRLDGATYVKLGVTHTLQPGQLVRVGEVAGTGVFVETGDGGPNGLVYLPVRPGCEFQPYAAHPEIRPRR
jgi:hypothetical protein